MRHIRAFAARLAIAVAVGLLSFANPVSFRIDGVSAQTTAPSAQTTAPSAQTTAPSAAPVNLDVDAPNAGVSVTNGQRVLVGGWAVAPGGQGSGIADVDVYLDGAPGTGTNVGTAQLGILRQDVATALHHPEWSSSGYTFDWTPQNVTKGAHTLYVVAHASNGQTATQTVQITACGCGWNYQPTYTGPEVTRYGTSGVTIIDTGGPGVWIQRDLDPFYGW